MSSLLLPDTAARGGRARGSRGGRRVVVPLAEYRAVRAGHPSVARPAADRTGAEHPDAGHPGAVRPDVDACAGGHADGAGRVAGSTGQNRPEAGAWECDVSVAGDPPLRLTRRGRAVARALAALALLVVVAGGVLVDRPALAGQDAEAGPVAERVVLPGETLWAIAGEVAPDVDRRETVAQIMELNDLASAEVRAGQRLAVPAPPR